MRVREEIGNIEWDGKSWPPPIGSIIESSATWEDGTPAEVLAVRNGKVIGCHVETGVAGWLEPAYCRPMRTAEDMVIQSLTRCIKDYSKNALFDDEPLMLSEALYRAIREGMVPGVKLEDAK